MIITLAGSESILFVLAHLINTILELKNFSSLCLTGLYLMLSVYIFLMMCAQKRSIADSEKLYSYQNMQNERGLSRTHQLH